MWFVGLVGFEGFGGRCSEELELKAEELLMMAFFEILGMSHS